MPVTMRLTRWMACALGLLAPVALQAACTVSSSGIAFGSYNPFATSPDDATGTIVLNCSAGSGSGAYGVALSVGGGGSYAARRMSSGSNLMAYQVYTSAARTTIWGNGTPGTAAVSAGDNRPQVGGSTSLTVYGRIAAQLVVAPGSYTDVLTITVNY